MATMPWVKLYTEILDDPKLGRMSDALKWRFIQLILLAGECDQEGLIPLYLDDISWRLRIEIDLLKKDLTDLEGYGLITINMTPSDYIDSVTVIKFQERQGRTQSAKREQWRDRQQRHRDKDKDVTGDTSVTNEGVTLLDKSKSREEEDVEEEQQQPFSLLVDAFINESGIPSFGGNQRDVEAGQRMVKAGVTPDDITAAVKELRDKDYNMVSIASVEKAAYNVKGKRTKVDSASIPVEVWE